jgi:hypothetical protein
MARVRAFSSTPSRLSRAQPPAASHPAAPMALSATSATPVKEGTHARPAGLLDGGVCSISDLTMPAFPVAPERVSARTDVVPKYVAGHRVALARTAFWFPGPKSTCAQECKNCLARAFVRDGTPCTPQRLHQPIQKRAGTLSLGRFIVSWCPENRRERTEVPEEIPDRRRR